MPSHCHRVRIGGTELLFSGAPLAEGGNRDELYTPFNVLFAEPPQSRIQIHVQSGLAPLCSNATPMFDTDGGWRVWCCPQTPSRTTATTAHGATDAGYVIEMPGRHGPLWRAHIDDGFETATASAGGSSGVSAQGRALDQGSVPLSLFRYPFDQILTVHHGATRESLLIHAAGFVVDGVGVMLAGVSGAGKSTVSRLLGGPYAVNLLGNLAMLSDDRVVVRRADDGRFWLHGSPWSGEARVASCDAAPLAAICLLRQANETAAQPIAANVALPEFLRVTSIPWYHRQLGQAALATCESVLDIVPCFNLHFTRDAGPLHHALRGLLDRLVP